MINEKIIETQGRLFQVKRKFPENRINFEKGSVSDLKDQVACAGGACEIV